MAFIANTANINTRQSLSKVGQVASFQLATFCLAANNTSLALARDLQSMSSHSSHSTDLNQMNRRQPKSKEDSERQTFLILLAVTIPVVIGVAACVACICLRNRAAAR